MKKVLFLSLLIPFALVGWAQDTLTYRLDGIVVSSSRWCKESQAQPVKITRISFDKANKFNPQTAADLLGLTGEVFIQKSQYGGGSPMIRGFATNRLLYSIDGVRMNTAIFRLLNHSLLAWAIVSLAESMALPMAISRVWCSPWVWVYTEPSGRVWVWGWAPSPPW